LLIALVASARAFGQKIVLVPLDNRPATGQYAELIGRIGGAEMVLPPMRLLGNYTIPGSPDAILKWIEEQSLGEGDALVVSADMISYGGLFESRKSRVPAGTAVARIKRLLEIRRKSKPAKLYLVSSLMRLTPSATHDAASYRLGLARYVQLRSAGAPASQLATAKAGIPAGAIEEYDAARQRNLQVQKSLIALTREPGIDLLVLGQDDAATVGPHVKEKAELRSLAVGSPRVSFCEGIDQIPALLVSRALSAGKTKPSIRIAYSDPAGALNTAAFESQPLMGTVLDQIVVSGAKEAGQSEEPDFVLYVNTPARRHDPFEVWLSGLTANLDDGKPVAVADVDLSRTSASPDPELYNVLADRGRPMKLWAYSAWNTAANSIGTAVAMANMRYLSLQNGPTLTSEVAHKQFLLYRMASDFFYHTFTRPVAYGMTEGPRKAAIFGTELEEVSDFVQRDLSKFLKKAFYDNFQGRRFIVEGKTYEFVGMSDLTIGLPWPRPYEVRLEFDIKASPVG
jgi:hypothetical protein